MIDKEQLSTYLRSNPRFDILLRLIESGAFDTPSNHLQEAAERAEQVIRTIHSEIGQDMDINPSAKRVYLSQMSYVGDQLSKALNTSVTSTIVEKETVEPSVDRVREEDDEDEDYDGADAGGGGGYYSTILPKRREGGNESV